MSLLVIGTLAYDTVETAKDRRDGVLGGSATYFAVAAAPLSRPRLVGVVGEDFRAQDLAMLEARGVDIIGVERGEGPSFRWGGRYEADWNTRHTLFTELGVFEHFEPKVPEAFKSSRFVFLANAHPAIQEAALSQVTHAEFSVADTMNLWIDIARPELEQLMRRIDGLILNDEEARMLTGEDNLIRAAQAVMGMGPKYVVLKKGEHGAFLMGSDAHFSLPAYPVSNVVDPTGAGDSFAGGFMGYLAHVGDAQPASLRRAMLYGTVTASYCVQGFSVEDLGKRGMADYDARYEELLSIVTV
jgi:sugar/nucleoside kinase (ribokinase family)